MLIARTKWNQRRTNMNTQHLHRVISLSQIINRNQARYKIHFSSEEELVNRDYWMKIIMKRANFAHFGATVVDETPGMGSKVADDA